MTKKSSKNFCKQQSKQKAEDAADNNFGNAVAHSFLEARELFFAHVQLADEHIQIPALVAHIHPQSGRVVNHDDGQSYGNGKRAGSDAVKITDRGN